MVVLRTGRCGNLLVKGPGSKMDDTVSLGHTINGQPRHMKLGIVMEEQYMLAINQ